MQNPDIAVVKTHASILVESLKTHGVKLKRTQALEVMAQLENRTDWNRLQAKLKNPAQPRTRLKPTKDSPDAIFVVSHARTGKTEILKTMFELECADGATSPVLISVSGNGHTFGTEIDPFFSDMERLDVWYDSNGMVESKERSYSSVVSRRGRGLLINLIPCFKGSRAGAGNAIAQVLMSHEDQFPYYLRNRIGTLMIDNLHEIDEAERPLVYSEIHKFATGQNAATFRRFLATSHGVVDESLKGVIGMNIVHMAPCETAQFLPDTCKAMEIPFHTVDCEIVSTLADRDLVLGVSWWCFRLFRLWDHYNDARTESRASRVPGKSLWYSDVRASLIR